MVRRQQAADRAIRPKLRSPGHQKYQRHVEGAFWEQIAKGLLAEEAAGVVGVAQAVGARWFENAGGMSPFDLKFAPSGRYLSFAEREEIALLKAQDKGVREIARAIGRDPGTISRELRRKAAPVAGNCSTGHRSRSGKPTWPHVGRRLRNWLPTRDCTAMCRSGCPGRSADPMAPSSPGPQPPKFTGRNKPHRKDRPWSLAWSPEQIANRLKVDFPEDDSMRISHEGNNLRGDLLIGLQRSAIGTVVERKTRYTMPIHLPREEGYRHKETLKNGPALAGHGAITMKNALANTMSTLPEQLARSLTWDRGKEMSAHAQFKVDTGIPVFFADPQSPWQRGTNENTNGLLHQYFPKGTDLSRWSAEEIEAAAHALNTRPRKTLGWKTPAEAIVGVDTCRLIERPAGNGKQFARGHS
ncbi:hypothetical protein MSAS_27840 [Mycobacterium saskatchewanense]|nr:hypothetical protein MSAS_27840 [Mycobacterium saskatchewanense]